MTRSSRKASDDRFANVVNVLGALQNAGVHLKLNRSLRRGVFNDNIYGVQVLPKQPKKVLSFFRQKPNVV
jgi:hypothetical protein